MAGQAQQLERPAGRYGQGEAYQPGPSIWPIVVVVGAAIALPGSVNSLPLGVQLGLIVSGIVVAVAGLIAWVQEDRSAPLHAARGRLIMAPADPPAPYAPPITGRRSEKVASLHLRTLREIARLRFSFPAHKYYKTYPNHPKNTMGVQMPGGLVAYPDIVVVQHPENFTKIVAQVETAETVNEDAAFYKWGPYAELAPLYLYVPVGKGDEALALCRKLDVPFAGIRTWRFIVGYDEIEISDLRTA